MTGGISSNNQRTDAAINVILTVAELEDSTTNKGLDEKVTACVEGLQKHLSAGQRLGRKLHHFFFRNTANRLSYDKKLLLSLVHSKLGIICKAAAKSDTHSITISNADQQIRFAALETFKGGGFHKAKAEVQGESMSSTAAESEGTKIGLKGKISTFVKSLNEGKKTATIASKIKSLRTEFSLSSDLSKAITDDLKILTNTMNTGDTQELSVSDFAKSLSDAKDVRVDNLATLMAAKGIRGEQAVKFREKYTKSLEAFSASIMQDKVAKDLKLDLNFTIKANKPIESAGAVGGIANMAASVSAAVVPVADKLVGLAQDMDEKLLKLELLLPLEVDGKRTDENQKLYENLRETIIDNVGKAAQEVTKEVGRELSVRLTKADSIQKFNETISDYIKEFNKTVKEQLGADPKQTLGMELCGRYFIDEVNKQSQKKIQELIAPVIKDIQTKLPTLCSPEGKKETADQLTERCKTLLFLQTQLQTTLDGMKSRGVTKEDQLYKDVESTLSEINDEMKTTTVKGWVDSNTGKVADIKNYCSQLMGSSLGVILLQGGQTFYQSMQNGEGVYAAVTKTATQVVVAGVPMALGAGFQKLFGKKCDPMVMSLATAAVGYGYQQLAPAYMKSVFNPEAAAPLAAAEAIPPAIVAATVLEQTALTKSTETLNGAIRGSKDFSDVSIGKADSAKPGMVSVKVGGATIELGYLEASGFFKLKTIDVPDELKNMGFTSGIEYGDGSKIFYGLDKELVRLTKDQKLMRKEEAKAIMCDVAYEGDYKTVAIDKKGGVRIFDTNRSDPRLQLVPPEDFLLPTDIGRLQGEKRVTSDGSIWVKDQAGSGSVGWSSLGKDLKTITTIPDDLKTEGYVLALEDSTGRTTYYKGDTKINCREGAIYVEKDSLERHNVTFL